MRPSRRIRGYKLTRAQRDMISTSNPYSNPIGKGECFSSNPQTQIDLLLTFA